MSFYCGNEGGLLLSKTPHQDYNGRDRCYGRDRRNGSNGADGCYGCDRCRGTTRCKRGNGKLRGIFLF